MNLSRTSSETQTVSVLASSNIEGLSDVAMEPVDISARVSGSGFRLLSLSMSDKVVSVRFDSSELVQESDGVYYADASSLFRHASEMFGSGVSVEAFNQQGARFRFKKEAYRKLPVLPVSYVTYSSQFTALDNMTLSRDSVFVYGDQERLNSVERILTEPITLRDLCRDARGVVALEVPPGLRLSESELDYYLPVGRFVEVRSKVDVGSRNVPAGMDLVISPSSAEVVWRCAFPVRKDPVRASSFYIDYHDFESSLTGKCVIKASDIPDGVISWTVEPQVCDCVLKNGTR